LRRLKIGLLGCGVVGAGFVRLLESRRSEIEQRAEARISIDHVVVRDIHRERRYVDSSILTTRGDEVVRNGVDLVVELIGGIDPAKSWVRDAIVSGKHVVTANKALLAGHGDLLHDLAHVHRVRIGYEASVGGAIPIVRTIRHGLSGDRIRSIRGVLNGTSNFVLSRCGEGESFEAALAEAQRLGYAEADPALDLNGVDALQKIRILARLAFGNRECVVVRSEGVSSVTDSDHRHASANGSVIRLVAEAQERGDVVELSVAPCEVGRDSPLGRATGVTNVVVVHADAAGELTLYGAGAGSLPSAGAVWSDVIEIARSL
jgi:homoserine dehydrogenase